LNLLAESFGDASLFILPDIGMKMAELERQSLSEEEKLEKKNLMMIDYSVKSERVHTVNQLLKAYARLKRMWNMC